MVLNPLGSKPNKARKYEGLLRDDDASEDRLHSSSFQSTHSDTPVLGVEDGDVEMIGTCAHDADSDVDGDIEHVRTIPSDRSRFAEQSDLVIMLHKFDIYNFRCRYVGTTLCIREHGMDTRYIVHHNMRYCCNIRAILPGGVCQKNRAS